VVLALLFKVSVLFVVVDCVDFGPCSIVEAALLVLLLLVLLLLSQVLQRAGQP